MCVFNFIFVSWYFELAYVVLVWRVEWHTYDIRLDLPPHNRILAGTVPSRVHTDPTSLSPTLTTFVASKNIRFEKDFQELVPTHT